MSSGPKRPFREVMAVAELVLERLSPMCERIEIAGSLRRECDLVGDIEFVAIPRPMNPRLDGVISRPYLLDLWLDEQAAGGRLFRGKQGNRQQDFRFWTATRRLYRVELWLQPERATWGQNLMIRTGSQDFSRWMVTPRSQGGAVPCDDRGRQLYVSRDARWRTQSGELVETPEEEDVFALLDVAWFEPWERDAGHWGELS